MTTEFLNSDQETLVLIGPNGGGKEYLKKLLAMFGISLEVIVISEELKLFGLPEEEIQRMRNGKRVSDIFIRKLLFWIFEKRRDRKVSKARRSVLLLDGFPRGFNQVKLMEEIFDPKTTVLLIIKALKEVCYRACIGRGRIDDTPEKILARWLDWEKEILPAAKLASEIFITFWIPGGRNVPDIFKLRIISRALEEMRLIREKDFDLPEMFLEDPECPWNEQHAKLLLAYELVSSFTRVQNRMSSKSRVFWG